MTTFNKLMGLMAFCVCYTNYSFAQASRSVNVPLNNLEAFSNAGKDWTIAATASADAFKPEAIKFTKGAGVLLNTSIKSGSSLSTKEEFGDVELNVDFMTTKSSVSAIYLAGRYGVKLTDSWTKPMPSSADMGGIEQRLSENNQTYEGTAPLMNAAKAPGLWQHLRIVFRSPKFENNVKVKNARFEEVYLNGSLVQQQNEVTGPTAAAAFKDEKTAGPLVFKGESIAFRNISVRILPELPNAPVTSRRRDNPVSPIVLNAENKPYLLRSFLMFDRKKRTHVISVGTPAQVNYSYDLKEGALLQVWRGQFLDVTEMWNERGEPQLARPLGSVLALSAAPAIAFLTDKDTAWPDSIAFDDFQNKGYTLDKTRMPAFLYQYRGAEVSDRIALEDDGVSLKRTLNITYNGPETLYCRITSANKIEALKNGLYAIGDQAYFIKIDNGVKPLIRATKDGQELIVPVGKNTTSITYSLIW